MSRKRVSYGIMVVLLSMFALTLAAVLASAQPTADSFGVNDASGKPGTHVLVPVKITNATNGPVLGIGFEIAYDKSVINVIDVSKGNLVSNWAEPNVNNNFTWGTKITIAGFRAADAIPNGTSDSVVLLNFSVIGGSPYKTKMNISGIQLSDPDGNLGTAPARNGTFTVSGVTPTPTPTPSTGDGGDGRGGNGGYLPIPTPTEKPPATKKVEAEITPALPTLAPTITPSSATPTPAPTSAPTPALRLTPLLLIFIAIAVIVIGGIIIYFM